MKGAAVILGPNVEPHDDSARVIGRRTTYHGDEHPYLRGYKVRIVAVLKNAAKPSPSPSTSWKCPASAPPSSPSSAAKAAPAAHSASASPTKSP